MMSGWFLVVLLGCGLVRAQVLTDENGDSLILNPEQTTEADLRVLLLDLKTRVEKLEREREDRGQSAEVSDSGL